MIRGTYSCIAVGLTLASRQVGLRRATLKGEEMTK